MNKTKKIILSIPTILGLLWTFTMFFPTEFHWLRPTMDAYYAEVAFLHALSFIQHGILLKKLWSFKYVEKSKKNTLTFVLIFFYVIAAPFFIWIELDKLEEQNKNTVPNIG